MREKKPARPPPILLLQKPGGVQEVLHEDPKVKRVTEFGAWAPRSDARGLSPAPQFFSGRGASACALPAARATAPPSSPLSSSSAAAMLGEHHPEAPPGRHDARTVPGPRVRRGYSRRSTGRDTPAPRAPGFQPARRRRRHPGSPQARPLPLAPPLRDLSPPHGVWFRCPRL